MPLLGNSRQKLLFVNRKVVVLKSGASFSPSDLADECYTLGCLLKVIGVPLGFADLCWICFPPAIKDNESEMFESCLVSVFGFVV